MVSGERGVVPGWLRKRRPGERLRVPSAGTAFTDRSGGVVEAITAVSGCVCVPSDRSQKHQWEGDLRISVRANLCVHACDCCVNQSLRSEVPTFKGRKMGQKISRQIKTKVASRRLRKSRGSKSPETKEEERQEPAMARDCVIEIESESKEIKEEEVLVVDPLTTSEEMLLGMARAIIARNETQKKQA